MNAPVSFEVAKMLKDKEFDIPVRNYYLLNEEGKFLYEGFDDSYWGDNRIVNWNQDLVGIKPFRGFLSAPTIVEVVMWLYEKHAIWIIADPSMSFSCWTPRVFTKHNTVVGKYNGIKEFNSPKEAYEAAIEYTLKNLI